MLPFPKRNANGDEVELDDDDVVLVEEHGSSAPSPLYSTSTSARAHGDDDLAQTVRRTPEHAAPRRNTMPPGSRRILAEDIEEDVAGQCLASIAAETAREGGSFSSSHIRAAIARPPALPPARAWPQVLAAPTSSVPVTTPLAPPSSAPGSSFSRLPSVHPPPFVRAPAFGFEAQRSHGYAEVPGVRDSNPVPAFVRRSSPILPPAAPSYAALTRATPAQPSDRNVSSVSSVAPVSLSQRPNEPTVIVVRERPKAAWIVAAAALGALGALTATRLLGPPALEAPVAAAAQAPLAPPPSTVVVVPAASSPPAGALGTSPTAPHVSGPALADHTTPAVMRFGDDQGVAIGAVKAAAPALAASPAPAPRAPTAARQASPRPAAPRVQPPRLGPALPDGSFGLGRTESAPAPHAAAPVVAPAPPAPAAPAPPAAEPGRKRALTPEQQLAEAQLKASMK